MSAPTTSARAAAPGAATTSAAAPQGALPSGRGRPGGPGPRSSLTLAAALATGLAALALAPLFEDLSWYPPSLLAIGVVAGTGWAVRRLGVPLPLHPVLQGAALIWLLVLLQARERAWGGLVPTVSAVADLRAVIGSGLATIESTVPPAPSDPAIVAIAVLGVGLVALLVDVSAVPLRMPVLAGAPLLALYLVPAVVLRGETPWWCFVVAAVGWLALLLADSRESLLAWGRVLGRQQRLAVAGPSSADDPSGSTAPAPVEAAPRYVETTRTPGLSSAARRIGVVAVAAAVVLPALVPGLTAPLLRLGQGPGVGTDADGSGIGGPVTLNPLVSLKREYLEADDRVVIRYRSDDPEPDYLRMVTLTEFDGTTWSPVEFPADGTEVNAGLPPEVPGMAAQSDYPVRRYDIAVDRLDNRYLPLPYPPITVAIGEGWRYEPETRVVYSTDRSSLGAGYVATTVDPTWTPEQLRAGSVRPADPQRFLRLLDASNAPASVADTAKTVVAGTTTPYDQAVALQNWFRSQFRYSTAVTSGNDADYLESFLREKVGYCEQFAATMALMARTLGIPARVAVGFTQGTRTGDGTWEVTIRDAHAWPELWLEGAGWVRFEPTPRSDSQAGVAVPTYAATTPGTSPLPTPTTTGAVPGGDQLAADRRADRLAENDARDDAGAIGDLPAAATSSSPWRWVVLGVLLLVGLALLVPFLVRLRRRRGRLGRDDPEGAWAELRDTVLDVGLPWSDAATPRRGGAALAREVVLAPTAAEALTRLVAATEAARYAPPGTPSPWTPDADVAVLRAALLAHVDGRSRLRALWWPPTVVAGASAGGAARRTGALRSDEGVALGVREGGSSSREPERLGV